MHKKLLVCDDSIFLFTIDVGSDDPSNRNLVVWGLTPAMAWAEVAKAPPTVTSQFFDFGHNAAAVEGVGEDAAAAAHDDQRSRHGHDQSNGYSSLHHWTASGETHSDVFRVWGVTVGKSAMFLKHTRLPQLLHLQLAPRGGGNARWRWVVCPHYVPRSARPFRFAL